MKNRPIDNVVGILEVGYILWRFNKYTSNDRMTLLVFLIYGLWLMYKAWFLVRDYNVKGDE